MNARGGYIGALAARGSAGKESNELPCAVRCKLCAPSAAYARAMASKHPYTAERLRQKARASADGARSDHPTVADFSCEYLWPPLLSVSSVIVFLLIRD